MMMTFRPGPALMTSDDCVATVDDHTGFLAKFGLSERYRLLDLNLLEYMQINNNL